MMENEEISIAKEKKDAIDILLDARELSTYLYIKNYVVNLKSGKYADGYNILTEIETFLLEKIKQIKGE